MVMTRHMCAAQEQKRKARTPEQRRRRRRQVLRECLDMLRDGVVKFQRDLDNAHRTYERNMDAILKQSRARRAAWAGATGATPQRVDSTGVDPTGVDPMNE
jgi:phosphoribosylcarboxyaminoimidazole (NCAIR) mutase